MKLAEAVRWSNTRQSIQSPLKSIALACGFEALHLKTFLLARARQRFPEHNVSLETGLYGNLAETLKTFARKSPSATAVVLEWSDLDHRLGFRAGVNVALDGQEILLSVSRQARRFQRLVIAIADKAPIVFVPPHCPLPAAFLSGNRRVASFEAKLRSRLAVMVDELSDHGNVRILDCAPLDGAEQAFSLRMLLRTGFPFTTGWASSLSYRISELMFPPSAKKGIVTDLDNTLWRGILGDDGCDGVGWTLETDGQGHALYQQLLAILAEQGVLIAVVSKNEMANVEQALSRPDLILDRDRIFPIKASWDRKSLAFGEVLAAWNILPNSVVFVDDSRMELDEIQSRYPEVTAMLYPTDDDDQLQVFLANLRDQFEDRAPREEDRLRLESIKLNAAFVDHANASDDEHEAFLSDCRPKIVASFSKQKSNSRAFELVNKTNQFNLNGVRYQAAEWDAVMARDESFLLSLAYEDKFGPLGTIAVMVGNNDCSGVRISSWVMSCRAFSRRIEYQQLAQIFGKFQATKIDLNYIETTRNGPFANFLSSLLVAGPKSCISLERRVFEDVCPRLYHQLGHD